MTLWLVTLWLSAAPTPVSSGATLAPPPSPAPAVALPSSGAAEPELPRSEPPELAGSDLDLGWTLVRTMVVLGIVVALAYLTLNVGLRKLLGIRSPTMARIVTVLERVPLDQKRSLFVVEAAGEVFLVGGSDASLTLLSKLDAEAVQKLKASAGGGRDQPVRLSPLLQKLLGRKDAPPPTT